MISRREHVEQNKTKKYMLGRMKWTYEEFIKPTFEELYTVAKKSGNSVSMAVFDTWIVRLFARDSSIRVIRHASMVDQCKGTTTFTVQLGYVIDGSVKALSPRYLWTLDWLNDEIIWNKSSYPKQ